MAERIEIPAWVAQRKSAERPKIVWQRAETIDGERLENKWLLDKDIDVFVTCETLGRRRVVKVARCRYGTVTSKLPGRVVAWMPTPEPYRE